MTVHGLTLKQPRATVALALSAAFPLVAQAAAGRIDFVVGEARAVAADGRSRPLAKGDEFDSGDTIETGNGRAWLRFTDGAQVSLQPQSQYRIDNYKYAGKNDGEERGFFSLLKGGLRTITGAIGRGERKHYGVNTAVATIGIRGTEYSITYGNSITVTTGEGIVEVCNGAGCLLLRSGETGYVAGPDIQPVMSVKKADLPPPPRPQEPQFSVADNATGSGAPALLGASLLSGAGYALAWASPVTVDTIYWTLLESSGSATFDTASRLTAYAGGGHTYSPTAFADVGTDGVIGWGRWVSGSAYVAYAGTLANVAYVVGVPTSAMPTSGTATYSLIGGTRPTDNSGNVGTLDSGSLTANFGTAKVGGNLGLSLAGHTYAVSWSNENITAAKFTPSTVNVSKDGGASSSNGNAMNGFFAGAGATSAGLAYKLQDGGTNISGAAAFRQN